MSIATVPEIYFADKSIVPDLFVYDFKMTTDVIRSKINLGMNMFSFLQVGKKQVHFAGTTVAVNREQSLLLRKGNWLWTELLETEKIYFCKLFFFSQKMLQEFIVKQNLKPYKTQSSSPVFIIRNDAFIITFLESLIASKPNSIAQDELFLKAKFDEIMLYLLQKYGRTFENYLQSLIENDLSPFKKIIESKLHSNLKLEEISFLCNMSLSTFKRNFIAEYNVSPGKWLQDQRLQKAKEVLEHGKFTASEIYLNFGYNNLSNFSIAFTRKFGVNPSKLNYVGKSQ